MSAAGSKILIEVATAYAITKVLLPVRVLVSVWGTPWFARVVIGSVGGMFRRFRGGKAMGFEKEVVRRGVNGGGRGIAAGTGATSGGITTKIGKGS